MQQKIFMLSKSNLQDIHQAWKLIRQALIWLLALFQGGNNISAKGTSDIASALKENSTITTVCEVFYSFAIVWLIESELVSEQPALLHIILEFHLKAWQLWLYPQP